jgi:hypothetical protein
MQEEQAMIMMGFPLLLIPFAIYNIFAFLIPVGFTDTIFTVPMMSGTAWTVSTGDMLVAFAIFLLYLEILKAARYGTKAIMDHLLSMILFVGMLVEFIMVKEAATSTFFILLALSFVDVIAGFSVSIRTAQRDVAFESTERLTQS